jgi:hypothetical protein
VDREYPPVERGREQKIAFLHPRDDSSFSRQKVFDDLVANIDENATNMSFDPA